MLIVCYRLLIVCCVRNHLYKPAEWLSMRFVPYSNLFGKDDLLATLARLGRIYTEEDKDAFQVSVRKA